MAHVLKWALEDEARALELILGRTVEKEKQDAVLPMADDQTVCPPQLLSLPVQNVTGEFVYVLLAIGLFVFRYEEPVFRSLSFTQKTPLLSVMSRMSKSSRRSFRV